MKRLLNALLIAIVSISCTNEQSSKTELKNTGQEGNRSDKIKLIFHGGTIANGGVNARVRTPDRPSSSSGRVRSLQFNSDKKFVEIYRAESKKSYDLSEVSSITFTTTYEVFITNKENCRSLQMNVLESDLEYQEDEFILSLDNSDREFRVASNEVFYLREITFKKENRIVITAKVCQE